MYVLIVTVEFPLFLPVLFSFFSIPSFPLLAFIIFILSSFRLFPYAVFFLFNIFFFPFFLFLLLVIFFLYSFLFLPLSYSITRLNFVYPSILSYKMFSFHSSCLTYTAYTDVINDSVCIHSFVSFSLEFYFLPSFVSLSLNFTNTRLKLCSVLVSHVLLLRPSFSFLF